MRKILLSVLFCLFLFNHVFCQCLLPSKQGDPLFPVTNKYSVEYASPGIINHNGSSVFNIAASKGKYYMMGNFTHLSRNQGSTFILDTVGNSILSSPQWKINGAVKKAIPDGHGNYFICGDFTRIGDSARNSVARIDQNGKPLAWNPKVDGQVSDMQIRNDTLFTVGTFYKVSDSLRRGFFMWSLPGDSLVLQLNNIPNPLYASYSFLLQGDSVIIGGLADYGAPKMWKFNFKDGQKVNWGTTYTEVGEVSMMQFSEDSSTIVYKAYYNGQYLAACNTKTGAFKYKITPSMNPFMNFSGDIKGLKVLGSKAYVVGFFESVVPAVGVFPRKGFAVFDANSGAISADELSADGYVTFIETSQGKLYLSGKFGSIKGVTRENFAVIDTGTFTAAPWELSPTDPVTAFAINGRKVFVSGEFNGINATRRNGFAAIDSATNAILPWNPVNDTYTEGKRMIIKGDTLFVLGITSRPSSCMINDFNTVFRIYSLSTGERLATYDMFYSRMYDFVIDSNYLYASIDYQLRRYSLPSLTKDLTWGIDFNGVHAPMYLMIRGNEMYSVGDNRFTEQCTRLPKRKGWFVEYNKQTGVPKKMYDYVGNEPYYDDIIFDHGLLQGNTIYVQGYFTQLNGAGRKNFAALDITNGSVTKWETAFTKNAPDGSFRVTSDLKMYNGKIWFGSQRYNINSTTNTFSGFGAIDTATGNLLPPIYTMDQKENFYYKRRTFNDFIFAGNSFIGAGSFDFVNENSYGSIFKSGLVAGTPPSTSGTAISGPSALSIGLDAEKFFVQDGLYPANTYSWSYSGSGVEIQNNGKDTVWLLAGGSAAGGQLSVTATNYCGSSTALVKTITIRTPPDTPRISNISDKCSHSPTTKAKLLNPPPGTTISIWVYGAPAAYDPSDSSFIYFYNGGGPSASSPVKVRYANANGISEKDTTFKVEQTVVPSTSISVTANPICLGSAVTFVHNFSYNTGADPHYQWQVNGVNKGTDSVNFTTWMLANNDVVKLIVTSSIRCALPATATQEIPMTVQPVLTPTITISGNTTVASTFNTTITANVTGGGTAPTFQWQDSTETHGWQNIAGATNSTLDYIPVKTGDKLRSLLRSNYLCVTNANQVSNVLTFTVGAVTGIDPVPANQYGIQYFPNPVSSFLVIDKLQLADQWQTIDIVSVDGKQKVASVQVAFQSKLVIPLQHLSSGVYIATLKSKKGELAYLRFVKL